MFSQPNTRHSICVVMGVGDTVHDVISVLVTATTEPQPK